MNGFSENFYINKKNSGLPKFFATAIALMVCIAILNFFAPAVKNYFFTISSPVEKLFWSAGESSSGFLASFFEAGSIAKENDNLKSENQKLIAQIISLQAINNANQAQSDVSLNCQNLDFQLLMAGVIGMDGQDIISINKGSDEGIFEDMPVVSQQGVALGKVIKVYKNYSQVMLISSPKSIVSVNVQINPGRESEENQEELSGSVKGKGNFSVYLDLVPVEKDIKEGDVLASSSLEKIFPKDLLVGKISKIQKNDQKPFQQAEVQPFFDLSKLENVFVIKNYKR